MNDFLDLVFEDEPVLLYEHALLHLSEDLDLVLAQRELVSVVQSLARDMRREAFAGMCAVGRSCTFGSERSTLAELEHRCEQWAISCLLFDATECEQVVSDFQQKLF